MKLAFSKYHGLGNDFILIDNRAQRELLVTATQAQQLCDRHFGVGANGVIFLCATTDPACDYQMAMYNSDGSVAEMCGNGIRCLAKFIAALESHALDQAWIYRVQTLAGVMTLNLQTDGRVSVNMGTPKLLASEIPTTLTEPDQKVIDIPLDVAGQTWQLTCVSMGNPHAITFVENVAAIPLAELGPQFEHHSLFPQRTNTEFVEVIRPDYLKMRVWERGAGATLACGTGACATVVAGVLTQRALPQATVELPGGCLDIDWQQTTQTIYMTGPANHVFDGVTDLED
ncbi:diaminopimelate epimerase [Thermosynechococcaceae cyanobacterium BACA0444]|uniref:Diaminopimelate epimerase n=1 Tax=Pseudocalidococcus azoricus BACA0444 TaxID=2918990 RepID=A0AAE4JX66_9CYAN|nr:diaminopimelate epimerase [Pseudocalidococcus azoricus]MDS3861866.1 diaminopimelate epimerase [Pseudocalidococcus azoricus BACA0444]